MSSHAILALSRLHVSFRTRAGIVHAVRGVSWDIAPGRTLAIMGESGCGKSVSVHAALGLIDARHGCLRSGAVRLHDQDLLELDQRALAAIRGRQIGMIFQDPMNALNPTLRIGLQIAEVLVRHRGLDWQQAEREAARLLERMRITHARQRMRQYPFEFSGGMLQRVMIAIALACRPGVLIADEPTTALDATVQDEVLTLIKELQHEDAMALVLITHDPGVVARMADEVVVMYAGQIVERGTADEIFHQTGHPYTRGLLGALPRGSGAPLEPIPGAPPDLLEPPAGCAFVTRCAHAMRICARQDPPAIRHGEMHHSRCWLHHAPAVTNDAGTE